MEIPPLNTVRDELAWGALAINGSPYPFIHTGSIRSLRAETQAYIGETWRRPGETIEQGWKRAYRFGWRCIRVQVSAY